MKRIKILSAISTVAVMAWCLFFIIPVMTQAALSTNASADVAVGQQNMTSNDFNQGSGPYVTDASKLFMPRTPFYDGSKFFVADMENHRVLIYNSIPTGNNASADVVIGQPDMTSNSANQGGTASANTLYEPSAVFSDGTRLLICDTYNNRVLIYNSIPTSNNASADFVIGQQNMTSSSADQGGDAGANTLNSPTSLFFNGKKIIVSDWGNNRVLIYNSIPTSNNASADVVIGQQNMTGIGDNQGGTVAANTLSAPNGVWANGKKFFIADQWNNRILIYNSIPTSNNASADVVIGQQNMTSNNDNQGGAVAANTLYLPTHIFPYGPKLLVLDSANNRMLVFNSIPTENNTSADVVIGQSDMISGSVNQGGTVAANTLYVPRGVFVGDSKLMIGDYYNNRVLLYNSFGPQWVVSKGHSRILSGDEKMKVKTKKVEFSGRKTEYKKGRVRIYVDGSRKKTVKIKKNGKWKAKFTQKGNVVKNFVIKYYNSHNNLQMNSETYVIGLNRGNLNVSTLQKAMLGESEDVRSEGKSNVQSSKPADLKKIMKGM